MAFRKVWLPAGMLLLVLLIAVLFVVRTVRVRRIDERQAQDIYNITHQIGEDARANQRNFGDYKLPAGLVALDVQNLMKAEHEARFDHDLQQKIDTELQWWLQQ